MFSVADDYKARTYIVVLHYIKRYIEANFGSDVTCVLVMFTIKFKVQTVRNNVSYYFT